MRNGTAHRSQTGLRDTGEYEVKVTLNFFLNTSDVESGSLSGYNSGREDVHTKAGGM